jgi:hypothetical protein
VEKGQFDYDMLTDEMLTGANESTVFFRLGTEAGAGQIINAFEYTIANLRVTSETKEDSDALRVLRSITGYAVAAGLDAAVADQELIVKAV